MLASAKFIRPTLKAMRDGLRFGYGLGATQGTPQAPEDPGPLEEYFDSVVDGPGIWKWRHYLPIYERHLSRFRGSDVHVVEIGIFSGGSLAMWREYFGDQCRVYGVDIEPACKAHERPGVQVFIGDQSDPAFWERFLREVPRIDVVIDDGGHESDQQIATVKALLPAMSFGGVYICEDIHRALHPFHSFLDGLTRPIHDIEGEHGADARPIHQHVAAVHHYPALTVIEKPRAPVHRFENEKRGTIWEPGITFD